MSKIVYNWSITSVGNYVKIADFYSDTIYLVPKNTLVLTKISENILQLNTLGENLVVNINYNDVISPSGSTDVENLMTLLAPIIYESYGIGTSYIQNVIAGANIYIDYTDPLNPIIIGANQPPIVVTNYSALPPASTVGGTFYWCSESQGISWLPGSLGGTFYNSGLYYSNGVDWEFLQVPYNATQNEVNDGIITDKFVTPATLKNSTQWDTKVNITDLSSNLVLYATNTNSDIPGYYKLVNDISDVDYNTTPVDITTGIINTTDQLISSLVTNVGIINGNPGIINLTTLGNIRKISGSGNAIFYYEMYHRNSLGIETLISTSSSTVQISNTIYELFYTSSLLNNGIFLPTDRIVIKYYASKIGGGSDPNYQFQFGGLEPVRTILPVPSFVVNKNALVYIDNIDANVGVLPNNARIGDTYRISVSGTNLGDIDGINELNIGDLIIYINLTGDNDSSNSLNWIAIQKNINDNSYELFDSNDILSLNFDDRLLYDNISLLSIDYNNRLLLHSNGDTVYDFENGILYYNNDISIDIQNRSLYNILGIDILNWSNIDGVTTITQPANDNSTFIATTEYVFNELLSYVPVSTNVTINSITQNLSTDITFNVGTILGTLPATSGQLTYSNGTLNTLTSSSSLTFTSNQLNVGTATSLWAIDLNISRALAGTAVPVGMTITNTNTTGVSGVNIGESLNNRLTFSKFGSTSSQAVSATSLNYQNTSVVASTAGGSFGGGNLYIQGSPIINIIGSTSTNMGTRLDSVGFKIDAINLLHSTNTILFQIRQSLYFNGNTLSLSSNRQYQSNATGSGNSRTWRWYNDVLVEGDFSFQQSTNNANMIGASFSNRFWLYFNPNGLIGIGNMTNPTATLHIAANTTTNAQLRLESGVAPTSPNNGDIWYTSNKLYHRSNSINEQIAYLSDITSSSIKTKSGKKITTDFSGSPLKATVTFIAPYADINYSISVIGIDARTWTIESQTINGFVINANAATALTGDVLWITTKHGEN